MARKMAAVSPRATTRLKRQLQATADSCTGCLRQLRDCSCSDSSSVTHSSARPMWWRTAHSAQEIRNISHKLASDSQNYASTFISPYFPRFGHNRPIVFFFIHNRVGLSAALTAVNYQYIGYWKIGTTPKTSTTLHHNSEHAISLRHISGHT